MEILRDFWALILSGVAVVAWLVRIEQKTKENEKDIRAIRQQRAEDLAAQRAARVETNEMLREVREDIKELLRKVGA